MENKVRKKLNEFFNNKIFIGEQKEYGVRTVIFTHYVSGYNMITNLIYYKDNDKATYNAVRLTSIPDNHYKIDELANYSELRKFILLGIYSAKNCNSPLISVHKDPWLMDLKYDAEKLSNLSVHDLDKVKDLIDNYKDNLDWLFNKYMPNEEI